MSFAKKLLQWFDLHGRKNLPWQHPIEPYRVWLSEIMLQQTQVETVIPYFKNFLEKFPDIQSLADADLDQVLHLWTGLGYYARARNLHKCARQVIDEYAGVFPDNTELLETLPGIGRSTAAAIASIAYQQPSAILDGNVKRVLARYHATAGWPGKSEVANTLWQHAEQHMPKKRCRDYTQAIMDLGATLCTRSRPACSICPLNAGCLAHQQGNPADYPGKKPKKILPVKTVQMLILKNAKGEISLHQRPPTGIWGGLWSFPELETEVNAKAHIEQHFGSVKQLDKWDTMRHTFSHYHLDIIPVLAQIGEKQLAENKHVVQEGAKQLWYNTHSPAAIGLAAPVKKLLSKLI
ncbi:A/G-specific DNA-adenine glycosylase [Alteromonadaceae bacterium Bs31]|nr:A/G-specific DNA-adenine glycosylase [Alteromonadaceae bacterium Bs31]